VQSQCYFTLHNNNDLNKRCKAFKGLSTQKSLGSSLNDTKSCSSQKYAWLSCWYYWWQWIKNMKVPLPPMAWQSSQASWKSVQWFRNYWGEKEGHACTQNTTIHMQICTNYTSVIKRLDDTISLQSHIK